MKQLPANIAKWAFTAMAIAECYAEWVHHRELIFFLRVALLPTLLLYYTLSVQQWNTLNKLMVVAIFFSYVGDFSLLMTPAGPDDLSIFGIPKNQNLFFGGVAGFMVSHFFFIAAYRLSVKAKEGVAFLKRSKWPIAMIALYGLTMLALVIPPVWDDPVKSPVVVPVIIYTIVLSSMVAFALNRKDRVSTVSFVSVLLGSILFLLSDSMIAINFLAYEGIIPHGSFWIMITFWPAEYLIADGMLKGQ